MFTAKEKAATHLKVQFCLPFLFIDFYASVGLYDSFDFVRCIR